MTGGEPLVNTTSPDFAGLIEQQSLHSVPENNYRWSAFALLTPGVVNDSTGFGLLSFRGQKCLQRMNSASRSAAEDCWPTSDQEAVRTRSELRERGLAAD